MELTLEQAQEHLDKWLAADLAVSAGNSYSIAGRSLSRNSVAEIKEQIQYWSNIVDTIKAKNSGRPTSSALFSLARLNNKDKY